MKFRARCDSGESNLRQTVLPAVVSRGIEASESFLSALFKAHHQHLPQAVATKSRSSWKVIWQW